MNWLQLSNRGRKAIAMKDERKLKLQEAWFLCPEYKDNNNPWQHPNFDTIAKKTIMH